MNKEPFENLDRLLQVEFRPEGLAAGIVPLYYQAVRQEEPITWLAASGLLALPDAARIAIVTGMAFEHFPRGEIDGPIGSVVLAHALTCLGKRAEVLVGEPIVPVVTALRERIGGTFAIVDTTCFTEVAMTAQSDDYDAAVTIEKLGKNRMGVRHSILGTPFPPETPDMDEFITALTAAGKLTIGIGDGGNEIGFGSIFERARALTPRGAACGCPCADGIVTATGTRLLLPANVSNFGAYAIVAGLAILSRKAWLLPAGESVVGLIQTAVAQGCLEGGTARPWVVADDGIPGIGVAAFVTLLGIVVGQTFSVFDRRF
jgi:hypothetical protein